MGILFLVSYKGKEFWQEQLQNASGEHVSFKRFTYSQSGQCVDLIKEKQPSIIVIDGYMYPSLLKMWVDKIKNYLLVYELEEDVVLYTVFSEKEYAGAHNIACIQKLQEVINKRLETSQHEVLEKKV